MRDELEVQVPFAGDVVRERAWAFNLCVQGEGAMQCSWEKGDLVLG